MKTTEEQPKPKRFTWGGIKVKNFYWSDIFQLGVMYYVAYKGDWTTALVIGLGFVIIKLSEIVNELMEINAKMKE